LPEFGGIGVGAGVTTSGSIQMLVCGLGFGVEAFSSAAAWWKAMKAVIAQTAIQKRVKLMVDLDGYDRAEVSFTSACIGLCLRCWLVVTECQQTAHFGFILGMEIICRGDLSITNFASQTWVSFRVPSLGGIDYVQEANKIQFAGVGRNDPCPCGKLDAVGKAIKFKKCHGAVV
jgi:hypothetical protein